MFSHCGVCSLCGYFIFLYVVYGKPLRYFTQAANLKCCGSHEGTLVIRPFQWLGRSKAFAAPIVVYGLHEKKRQPHSHETVSAFVYNNEQTCYLVPNAPKNASGAWLV